MNLSVIAAGITLTLILIFGFLSYKAEPVYIIPDISRFPFNQATGKERSFVNKNGDTSLWTESRRRIAIASNYRCGSNIIRESRTASGSSTGAVEAYILSNFGRLCPGACTCCNQVCDLSAMPGCPDTILDGNDDGCILDGNDDGLDILDGN